MIRETLPDCGGQASERAVATYRMWHCFDCGLRFSMCSRTPPMMCPGCGRTYEATPLDILPARGGFIINLVAAEPFSFELGEAAACELTISELGWFFRRKL